MTTPMIRRSLVAASALLLVGCSGTPATTPSTSPSVAPPATSAPAASATPSVSASTPSRTPTATSTPTASATRTASATSTAKPSATGTTTAKRKPTVSLSCKPDVSENSGDPILRISYRVTDPDRVGWRLVITYTNAEGNMRETADGRGSTSKSYLAYGLDLDQDDPHCKATITPRS